MKFHHICPDCGLDVVTDHSTVQIIEVKVCGCPTPPVETVEDDSL